MSNITNSSSISNDLISISNEIIGRSLSVLSHQSFLKTEFNSGLKDKDHSICHESLVSSRFLKKYNTPSDKNTVLRDVCYNNYLEFDATLPDHLNLWQPGSAYLTLRKARSLLSTWLNNTTIDSNLDCEFSPGESFLTTKGDVSILGKLQNKKHWTTTWNQLDETISLIYHTLELKRMARLHIGFVSSEQRRELFRRYAKYPNSGYMIFRDLLLDRVITVSDGARAASVPKNNETNRFINVETMFGCLLQRRISNSFLRVLGRVGNSLDVVSVGGVLNLTYDAQEIHRRMISNADYATIDFSNASDSISTASVHTMFPEHISRLLFANRSHYVSFRDSLFEPKKLSSMGNGFTFETMTLLLLSVGRTLDPTCRVFGDDVIIHNDVAQKFIDCCQLLGFVVNDKKSFINSRFRESCGSYFHDDVGYLTSYDIKYITNPIEYIVTLNKIFLTACSLPLGRLKHLFIDLYEELLIHCPASLLGPPQDTLSSRFVFCRRWKKRKMASNNTRIVFRRHINVLEQVSRILQMEINPFVCIFPEPHFKNRVGSSDPRAEWAAVKYGNVLPFRTIRNVGTWTDKVYVSTECGNVMSLKEMYDLVRTFKT